MGVAYGLGRLLEAILLRRNGLFALLVIPLFLINLPFIIARYSVAVVVTVLAAPIVWVVDKIADGETLRQKALTLKIKEITHTGNNFEEVDTTLSSYLANKHLTFDELGVKGTSMSELKTSNQIGIRIDFEHRLHSQVGREHACCYPCTHADFYYSKIFSINSDKNTNAQEKQAQKEAIKALLELDIGGVGTPLEEKHSQELNTFIKFLT